MLGLGLESVGYSSVKSELHSDGQADSFAQPTGKVEKTIHFTGLALTAVLALGYAQADFFSPGDAKARALAENSARLLKRNSSGSAWADAELTGWQEAIVTVEPQEAVAEAVIIGLPDGYYGEGAATAGAYLAAAPNKVQRGTSRHGVAESHATGDEHVTRNAYSQAAAIATVYGEWQLNNELFATGSANSSALLASQAHVYPALDPLVGDCFATGSARVRFRESATAVLAASAETLACEHRKGAAGASLSVAMATGQSNRMFHLSGRQAAGYGYADGQIIRTLFPDAEMRATAAGEASSERVTPASGDVSFSASAAVGVTVKYLIGSVDAVCMASAKGGVKLNDYYPAPEWRRLVVGERQSGVAVEQTAREMVV
jgi:hypothetical protein